MTNDWIELNLPFRSDKYFDNSDIPIPALSERAKAELGFNLLDIDAIPIVDFMEQKEEYDILQKDLDDLRDSLDGGNEIDACLAHSNINVRNYGKRRKMHKTLDEWEDIQPEYIIYDIAAKKAREEFDAANNKKSFCGLGLDNPGVLIEIKKEGGTKQLLLGNVNCLAGVCDDCRAFDNDTIVLRYKIVWEKDGS
jgi:hypothetical protein